MLCACDIDLTADLFISDIKAVFKATEPIQLETKIRLEMSGKDSFDENKEKLRDILTATFGKISDLRYEDGDMTGYAVCKVGIKLFNDKPRMADDFMAVLAGSKPKYYSLNLLMNQKKFRTLADGVQEEFLVSLEPDKLSIILAITNDEPQPVKVASFSSYVNGDPQPNWRVLELKRRKKLEMRLSSVATSYTVNNGALEIFRLAK